MKGNWHGLPQSRFWLICNTLPIKSKGNWLVLAQSWFWLICNQILTLKIKGKWSRLAQSRFRLPCNQILIENDKKLVGSKQIFIDLQSNSNWKWKEISLGRLRADFSWFELNDNWKWKEIGSDRFQWICDEILIENERNLASAGSRQIFIDLLLNSNRKWKEIGVGWLKADLGWFVIKFE